MQHRHLAVPFVFTESPSDILEILNPDPLLWFITLACMWGPWIENESIRFSKSWDCWFIVSRLPNEITGSFHFRNDGVKHLCSFLARQNGGILRVAKVGRLKVENVSLFLLTSFDIHRLVGPILIDSAPILPPGLYLLHSAFSRNFFAAVQMAEQTAPSLMESRIETPSSSTVTRLAEGWQYANHDWSKRRNPNDGTCMRWNLCV